METGGGCIERGGHPMMRVLQSACQAVFLRLAQNGQPEALTIVLRAHHVAPQVFTQAPSCTDGAPE